jgi:hypothetical protein
MKIVIDIPDFEWLKNEEDFKTAVKEYEQGTRFDKEIRNALINGTPLPEHYGDLIDRDAVLDDIVKKNPEWVSETGKRKRYARLVYYWAVKNAPTIVEGSGSK